MPTASIKKKIPCSKNELIKMVLDIEKYPEFVPWCLRGKIYSKEDKGDKEDKSEENKTLMIVNVMIKGVLNLVTKI